MKLLTKNIRLTFGGTHESRRCCQI